MADSINKSFFDALLDAKAAKWSAGVAFDRSNPLPLDQWSVFKDKAAAEAYLTNAKAYPGQVIAYAKDDGSMEVCVLEQNLENEEKLQLSIIKPSLKIEQEDSGNASFSLENGAGYVGLSFKILQEDTQINNGKELIEGTPVLVLHDDKQSEAAYIPMDIFYTTQAIDYKFNNFSSATVSGKTLILK